MKRHNVLFIGLILFVLMFVSACTKAPIVDSSNPNDITGGTTDNQEPADTDGTQTGSTDNVVMVKIEAYDFGFRVLNDVDINEGDTVRIVLTSTEGTHGLSMPDFNVNIGPVSPGETKTADFVADKSGTFTFFCNVPCGPGHSNMKSSLTIF